MTCATFSEIMAFIRKAYPSGKVTELNEECARDVVGQNLPHLADALSADGAFGWELFGPEPHEKCYRLIVSPAGLPRWSMFFREMSLPAKLELLRSMPRPACYWTVLVSRIGPYWLGLWNCFAEVKGRVGAASIDTHPDATEIEHRVARILSAYGLERVDNDTIYRRVVTHSGNVARFPGDASPTLFSYLFSEV